MGKSKSLGKKGSEESTLLMFVIAFVVSLFLFGASSMFGVSGDVGQIKVDGDLSNGPNDLYGWVGTRLSKGEKLGPYPHDATDPVNAALLQVEWYFKKFRLSLHPEYYFIYRETGKLPYEVPPSPMWEDQLYLDPGKNYPSLVRSLDGRGWIYRMLDPKFQRQEPIIEALHGRRCVDHLQRLDLIFQGKANQIDWNIEAFQSSGASRRHGFGG